MLDGTHVNTPPIIRSNWMRLEFIGGRIANTAMQIGYLSVIRRRPHYVCSCSIRQVWIIDVTLVTWNRNFLIIPIVGSTWRWRTDTCFATTIFAFWQFGSNIAPQTSMISILQPPLHVLIMFFSHYFRLSSFFRTHAGITCDSNMRGTRHLHWCLDKSFLGWSEFVLRWIHRPIRCGYITGRSRRIRVVATQSVGNI